MSAARRRWALRVRGVVQGVGFRPFVARLAAALAVGGWVRNDGDGVVVEVEGTEAALEGFVARLVAEAPAAARVAGLEQREVTPRGEGRFVIVPSAAGAAGGAGLVADLVACEACVREVFDPGARRFRYPFACCTACGPRYSVLLALPWDRERTTMRGFALCGGCRAEYEDPADRRFHAEPIACAACGPRLALEDGAGRTLAREDEALGRAAEALRAGAVVAVKGLGGFQLLVDGRDAAAVGRLRARKGRPDRPFAVMVGGLEAARAVGRVGAAEAALLTSAAGPIVLVERRAGAPVCEAVAPRNPDLGVMLPTTPLHHLLLAAVGGPVVATSGNRSGEPLCVEGAEARERLAGVADLWLTHDRPIARPLDDSVVRVMAGEAVVLRRARGYAPGALPWAWEGAATWAAGGDQKGAVGLAAGGELLVGAHLGELSGPRARARHRDALEELARLRGARPARVAHDAHPDYASTRAALELGLEAVAVQHHHAHVAACMAEHGLRGPALGLAWDGVGLGADGAAWGGEALVATLRQARRFAHLRPFPLPGGDRAARDPRRAALGLLVAHGGGAAEVDLGLPAEAVSVMRQAVARGVNAPATSSVGRLFDAVAALLGVAGEVTFEGQAAMALEHAARGEADPWALPLPLVGAAPPLTMDWGPLLDALLSARARGVPASRLSAGFHEALARSAVEVAARAGLADVLLTGGCFQNRRLLETCVAGLSAAGFRAWFPKAWPPNDGGLALGQLAVACAPHVPEEVRDVSGHPRAPGRGRAAAPR